MHSKYILYAYKFDFVCIHFSVCTHTNQSRHRHKSKSMPKRWVEIVEALFLWGSICCRKTNGTLLSLCVHTSMDYVGQVVHKQGLTIGCLTSSYAIGSPPKLACLPRRNFGIGSHFFSLFVSFIVLLCICERMVFPFCRFYLVSCSATMLV